MKTLKEKLKTELHDVLKEINKHIHHLGDLRIKEEHSPEKGSYVFVEFVDEVAGIAKRERKIADVEIENKLIKMYSIEDYNPKYKNAIEPVYAFLRKFMQENGLEEVNYNGKLY